MPLFDVLNQISEIRRRKFVNAFGSQARLLFQVWPSTLLVQSKELVAHLHSV